MINKIKKYIMKLWDNRRWKIYLYYDGIKIKELKMHRNELEDLKNTKFCIDVYFKKQLFKSNMVNVIVSPAVLLYSDEKNRVISIGVVIEQGTRL